MYVLVDTQLPPSLARWITDQGEMTAYVADLGMVRASDWEIWNQAKRTGAVIVSKDEDFAMLHILEGDGSPVLRLRNCRRQTQRSRLPVGGQTF